MAITLRDDFSAPLIEKLADILSRAKIENNSYLSYSDFYELEDLEKKLEKKPIGKLIQDYVSDSPLIDFFIEALSEEIRGARKFDFNIKPFPLTDIEEYKDPSSLAARLVKDFKSLPHDYKLFIKLPIHELKELLRSERIELSNSLSLVYPSQELQATFLPPIYQPRNRPIFTNFFSRAEQSEPTLSWEDWQVYCEISVQGFIGIYEDTYPIKRANFLVRAFCGLSLALQLFEAGFGSSVEDSYIKVYENTGTNWQAKKTRILPTEFVHGLRKLRLHKSYEGLSGIVKPRPTQILNGLKWLFSNESENERLLRAAQWYFDSYCGDNELLSFVKATICLEILLGDKKVTDIIGIMETLRNRCAYLIGLSHKDREQILSDFNEIYSTRSQIVHSGKNRLSKLERESFYKLRLLCARVIRKEILLGNADR